MPTAENELSDEEALAAAVQVFTEQAQAEGIDLSQVPDEQLEAGFNNWLSSIGGEEPQVTDKQAEAIELGQLMALSFRETLAQAAVEDEKAQKVASAADQLRAALGMAAKDTNAGTKEAAVTQTSGTRSASTPRTPADRFRAEMNTGNKPKSGLTLDKGVISSLKGRLRDLGGTFSVDQAKRDIQSLKDVTKGRGAVDSIKNVLRSGAATRMGARGAAAGGAAAALGLAGKAIYDRSKGASALDQAAEAMILQALAEENPEAYNQLVAERAAELLQGE